MRCGKANLVTALPSVSSACLASNATVPPHYASRRYSRDPTSTRVGRSAISRVEFAMHMGSALSASVASASTDTELAAVSGAASA